MLLDDDNSSFGSRGINPLRSAQKLDSSRKQNFALSTNRNNSEIDENEETSPASGDNSKEDQEMTPAEDVSFDNIPTEEKIQQPEI